MRLPTLDQIRNFVVDVVLVGSAVSYASGVVQDWLLAHEVVLAYIVGALHIVMLPLLLVALVVYGTPRRGRAARHALLWSLMAYYALGFIVPIALDEHGRIGNTFRSATIGGQVGVTLLTLVVLLKASPGRVLAHMKPRAVRWLVSFFAGAYLLCLEAALMTIAHGDHAFAGSLGLVACAIVGYLPVRLYLAIALEGHEWDLVAMALAFVHFVWRLVT